MGTKTLAQNAAVKGGLKKMSPIRHSTQCESMESDVKKLHKKMLRDGCNL
jgi:hypothetical protein